MKIAQGECSTASDTWPGPGVRARTLAGRRFKPCDIFPSFSKSRELNPGVIVCQAKTLEKIFSTKKFFGRRQKNFSKKFFLAES